MTSLYLLIPIAIVFVCIAVGVFLWAVKTEQFDDLERQGYDILFDESKPNNQNADQHNPQESNKNPWISIFTPHLLSAWWAQAIASGCVAALLQR